MKPMSKQEQDRAFLKMIVAAGTGPAGIISEEALEAGLETTKQVLKRTDEQPTPFSDVPDEAKP